jgi:hypothetical protein
MHPGDYSCRARAYLIYKIGFSFQKKKKNVSSNLLTLHYFTKACYVYFVEPYYFSYTYEYILKCFT